MFKYNVRFVKNGAPKGREYSYLSTEPYEAGTKVVVDTRTGPALGVVSRSIQDLPPVPGVTFRSIISRAPEV